MRQRLDAHDLRPGLKERGFIALISVIIIGALIVSIGISASFIGTTAVIVAGDADRGHDALTVATACVEEALHRLKLNSSYTGGTVTVGSDTCTAAVTGSGNSRTIVASSTVLSHTKTITVSASRRSNSANSSSGWGIASWTEGDSP